MNFKLLSFVIVLFVNVSFGQDNIYDVARKGCEADIVAIVKEYPEVVDYKDVNGFTPLTLACYYGNIEVVNVLASKVKDIDAQCNYGTALMAASFKGYTSIVELLIKHGANINATDLNGVTALHYAVRFTNFEMVKLLVEHKADVHVKDSKGLSPLDYAKQFNNDEIFKNIE